MKALWVAGSSVKQENALAFLYWGKEHVWVGSTAASAYLIFTVTFPNEVYLCPSPLHDHQSLNTVIQEYVCLGFLQRC